MTALLEYLDLTALLEYIDLLNRYSGGPSWGLLGPLSGWGPGQNAPVAPPCGRPCLVLLLLQALKLFCVYGCNFPTLLLLSLLLYLLLKFMKHFSTMSSAHSSVLQTLHFGIPIKIAADLYHISALKQFP